MATETLTGDDVDTYLNAYRVARENGHSAVADEIHSILQNADY